MDMFLNQSSLPELSISDIDTLCQHYLTILYSEVQKTHVACAVSKTNIVETYGEILYPSVNKLISAIQLTENDIFIDLGSGMGKLVIHFFLKSNIKAAYGIELVPHLHQKAMEAANMLHHDLPCFYHDARQLNFILGSFLDIPFKTATIALITSTCFTQSLLNELGVIIENTPSIHTVLSLHPIGTLQRLAFKKAIRIECSWGTALCYIYGA